MFDNLKSFASISFLFILILTATVANAASQSMLTMFCEGAITRAACLVTEPNGIKSLGEILSSGGSNQIYNDIDESKQSWRQNSEDSDNVTGEFHLLNLFLKKQGSYKLSISAKELTSVVAAFNLVKWTDKDGRERWLSKTGAAGNGASAVFNMRHHPNGRYMISVTRVASINSLVGDINALTTLGWIEGERLSADLKNTAESYGGTVQEKKDCLVRILSLIREGYGEGVNHRAVTVLTEDIDYIFKRL